MNDYGIWLVLGAMVAAYLFLRLRGSIGTEAARRALREGAVVIDVRTAGEFAAGALPKARNIPLDELSGRIGREVPDKGTVVLCHCASGMRSASAAGQLRRLGYARAYNLSSFARAARLLHD
jgi:phage shock protein E